MLELFILMMLIVYLKHICCFIAEHFWVLVNGAAAFNEILFGCDASRQWQLFFATFFIVIYIFKNLSLPSNTISSVLLFFLLLIIEFMFFPLCTDIVAVDD